MTDSEKEAKIKDLEYWITQNEREIDGHQRFINGISSPVPKEVYNEYWSRAAKVSELQKENSRMRSRINSLR